MHNLVVQCLLILVKSLYNSLKDSNNQWDIYRAIMWMNQEREVHSFNDDEDERLAVETVETCSLN
jgi:hypothetical protein